MFKSTILIAGLLLSLGLQAEDINHLDKMMRMQTQIDELRKQQELDQLSRYGATSVTLPSVVSLSCFGGTCSARVVDDAGIVRTLEVGNAISGVGTVDSISDKGVYVSTGKKKPLLQLPYHSVNSASGAASPLANVLPPMPR